MFRVIEPNQENDYTLTIKGYQSKALRAKILGAMQGLIEETAKETKLVLPLYPQVFTVLGEIKAQYNKFEYTFAVDRDETMYGETIIITIRRK